MASTAPRISKSEPAAEPIQGTCPMPNIMQLIGGKWKLIILQMLIVTVYGPAESVGLRLFYRDYLLNLRRLGFAEVRHIVYDHLVAPTAHYLRRVEVESWLLDAALADGRVTWVHRNSWAAVGVRAAA